MPANIIWENFGQKAAFDTLKDYLVNLLKLFIILALISPVQNAKYINEKLGDYFDEDGMAYKNML